MKFASFSKEELYATYINENKIPHRFRWSKSTFIKKMIFAHQLTLAHIILYTGRTHQIRVHSNKLGFPILGDPLYNRPRQLPNVFDNKLKKEISKLKRQLLHAVSLGWK